MKNPQIKATKTAILLFAYSKEVQLANKQLSEFKENNKILWDNIYAHKIKTIQKTNLPFFLSNENNQVGVSFGQKLNHSIQEVFNQGFDKVIVVGNDCLSLTEKDLLNASSLLQKNDFILGKDFNGGAYLLGVSKDKYNSQDFENLSWQTKKLYIEIHSLFCKNKLRLLSSKADFNNQFQFQKALDKLSFSSFLKKILSALFHNKNQIFEWFNVEVEVVSLSINFNKGPPLLNCL
ncbi:MAG: DUF2064 domain-containing protein [Flavobacterium sp.]|nr:DUF2064 domain-containing protein [Flavobacterium sp.]